MPHLPQGLGFDLADALAGNLELLAHLFQRPAVAVDQAEAQGQHPALAFREGIEDVDDFLPQERERGHVIGVFRALVFDKVAKAGVIAVADG